MTENDSQPLAPDETATIAIRRRWAMMFPLAGAIVGLIVAFTLGPVVAWLLNQIGDAPGPMRLAALLPLAWAIPVLMIIGAVVGFLLLAQWDEDAGTVRVDARGITVERKDGKRRIARERINGVFTDGNDLIIVDAGGRELLRTKTDDELAAQLGPVLEQHSYPYLGAQDPREGYFVTWVDGEEALDVEVEALLRDRHRAKLDKKQGRMQELSEQLSERGIAIRDRDEEQQYRVIGAGE